MFSDGNFCSLDLDWLEYITGNGMGYKEAREV